MSGSTPRMREFAGALLALERGENPSGDTPTAGVFPVFEKLRVHMTALMGKAGFSALVSRSLELARAEVAWLSAMHIDVRGLIEGEADPSLSMEALAEGHAVMLAHLLGLMVIFIGESLTIRLVQDIWPEFSPEPLASEKGAENETKK